MRARIAAPLKLVLFFSVVTLGAATLTLGEAGASSRCQRVHAKLTLAASNDPLCASPIGLCATGSLKGDLNAGSSFVGSSFLASVDTPVTGVTLLTGDNRIESALGTLLTKDSIVLHTTGAGEFAELDVIVGGTGAYAGATGTLSATGTYLGGSGSGELSGEICRP